MKLLLAILLFSTMAFGQLTITAPCNQATVGVSYTCLLTASESGAIWTLAGGILPPGLSLSQLGLISGTPTTEGTYNATIEATVPNTATATVSISVVAPAPPPATGTLCPQMSNNAKWPSGYAMYNDDVGGNYPTVQYIRYVPSKSGTAIAVKWYNSADSHALRNACSKAYGSIQPCDSACGDPKYRTSPAPGYSKACPNGWKPFADACASNPSGCYSAGTGGKMVVTLIDNTLKPLASVTVDQPTVKYGFRAAYPVLTLSNGPWIDSGKEYYLKVENTDASPKSNWFSWNFWTPYNLFTEAQAGTLLISPTSIGGKSGVANAVVLDSPSGSPDTKFQPIFGVSYSDGTCSIQGF